MELSHSRFFAGDHDQGLSVAFRPPRVRLIIHVFRGDEEGTEALFGKLVEKLLCLSKVLLTRRQSLLYNRVSPLTNHQNSLVRCLDHYSHPLAGRVEFDNVQQLVFKFFIRVGNMTDHVAVFVSIIKMESEMSATVDEGQLVWRRSIIHHVFLLSLLMNFFLNNACVAQSQCLPKSPYGLMVPVIHIM